MRGTGNIPGVLLRVTRRCKRGVVFRVRFAVGLSVFIIPGASVMRRRGTVMMGDSFTTLCSRIRGITLCSTVGSITG